MLSIGKLGRGQEGYYLQAVARGVPQDRCDGLPAALRNEPRELGLAWTVRDNGLAELGDVTRRRRDRASSRWLP